MKIRIFVAALALFTLSTTSQAQIDATANPLGILFGSLSVGADFLITDNISVEPTIGYGTRNRDLLGYQSSAFTISTFGKYYFNPDNGADKFYGSVWLRYVNRSIDWDEDFLGFANIDYNETKVGIGLGIGWKIVSNNGIVFDIGAGLGRSFINTNNLDDDFIGNLADISDLMVNGKLGVGYRFGG